MAGIANKIGETLNMGGGKKEGDKSHDQHKSDPHGECKGEQIKPGYQGECKGEQIKPGYPGEQIKPGQQGERKEGLTDKIKDKISGEGGHEKCETKEKKTSDRN